MPGGILQLIAKGIDDAYLINDPQITLFKCVYRRHANFSQFPKILNFNRNLTFENISRCKIPKDADLVTKLNLQITLPPINMKYKSLTNMQVHLILKPYGIYWYKNDQIVFTQEDYDEVNVIADYRINELNNSNIIQEFSLKIINDEYIIPISSRDYADSVFTQFIKNNKYEILYNYMVAYRKDIGDISVNDFDYIFSFFYNTLVSYFIPPNDTYIYLEPNVIFYHVIEFGKYIYDPVKSSDMKSIFDNVLSEGYNNSTEYLTTDAFIVYNKYFNSSTRTTATSQNDIDTTKTELLSNINNNLTKNIYQTINTINILKNNIYTALTQYRFSLFKKFDFISTGNYNGNNLISLLNSNNKKLNNYFTDILLKNNNSPTGFTNFFGNDISTSLQVFFVNIVQLFQLNIVTDYLADINLWDRLKLSDINATFSPLDSLYLMNTIPWFVVDDIPKMVNQYFQLNTDYNSYASYFDLYNSTFSNNLKTNLQNNYDTYSNGSSDININGHLTELLNDYLGADDKILDALLKPEKLFTIDTSIYSDDLIQFLNFREIYITDNFELQTINISPIEYVIHSYILEYTRLIFTKFSLHDTRVQLYNTIVGNIVNLFRKPVTTIDYNTNVESVSFPSYKDYINNNYSFYDINTVNSQSVYSQKPIYMDAVSSLWYYFDLNLISLFNNLFAQDILNQTTYNTLGSNTKTLMGKFLTLLDTNGYDYKFNYIDMNFYKLIISEAQYNTLNDDYYNMITTYNKMFANYQINRPIFNIKFAVFNKTRNYFRKFTDIYKLFREEMLAHPDIYYPVNKTDTTINNMLNVIESTMVNADIIGSIDVKYTIRDDLNNAIISTTNPYTNPSNLYSWYQKWENKISLLLQNQFDFIMDYMNDYDSSNQYLDENIFNRYNILNSYKECAIYMSDLIIKQTNFSNYINKINSQITLLTYNGFISIPNSIINNNINILKQISTSDNIDNNNKFDGSIVSKQINPNYNNIPLFAWIKFLGFQIIDYISLEIGGQEIDRQTGEFMYMLYLIEKNNDMNNGLDNMIGNIPELYDPTPYKDKHVMFIPLKLFFCKNFISSLPLICMNDTDIEIVVKLKKLTDVAIWDKRAIFIKKPKLECKILSNYIYVDKEDRKRLSLNKHQYLYEYVQYSGDTITTKITSNTLMIQTYFNNPCKYVMGKITYIVNGVEVPNIYIDGVKIQPITRMKLKINGNDRESYHDFKFYNLVQPYSYNCGSFTDDNMFFYSFCLNPKQLQPSGALNMSKVSEFAFIFEINPLVDPTIKIKVKIFGYHYCWLRIMSGMAGKAFT